MTSLRTLLSLALAALFAAPVAAGAAVTATTISEPVSDPSRARVRGAGGHDAQGQRHVERRHRPPRPALRGRGDRRSSTTTSARRPPASGRRRSRSAAGQQADAAHVLPARRAPRQRGHQSHRLPGQARDVPALARDRRRRRSQQRRAVRLPLLGAAAATGARSGSRVSNCGLAGASTITPDTFRFSGSAFPCAGFVAPNTSGRAGRARRSRQRVHARTARPRSSPARPTRSACSPRRPPSRPTRAPATCSSARPRTCCAAAPTPATLPATAADLLVVRLRRRQARPRDHPAGRRQAGARHRHVVGDRRPPPRDRRLLRAPPGRQRARSSPSRGPAASRPIRRASRRSRRATAPFSFFTRASPSAADGDVNNPQGAITLQDRPTALRFRTSTAIWTQYVRTVTPETPTHISFGFSWATAQADLTTLIGQAERALGPTHCLVPNLVGKTLDDLEAPAARRPLQGRQDQARDLEGAPQGPRDPAGPPPRHHAAGRQRRDAAGQLPPDRQGRRSRASRADGRYSVE